MSIKAQQRIAKSVTAFAFAKAAPLSSTAVLGVRRMKELTNISDTNQLYCIDAIRMHYEICQEQWKSINRLKLHLEKQMITKNPNKTKNPNRSDTLKLISSSWLFIDSIYRIGKLANNVRGLSHKPEEYRDFSETVKKAKDFRDIYQHLDKEIRSISDGNTPIMGLFSWVCQNKTTSITLSLGMIASKASIHSMTVDRYEKCFVHDLQFSANNKDLFFTEMYKTLEKFITYFNCWLKDNDHLGKKIIKPSVLKFDISQI